MGKHYSMTGKSRVRNLTVTNNDMVTLSIDKGQDLTDLIQNLEAARRDNRTTKTVHLWVKNGKAFVSNRWKAPFVGNAQ